MYFVNAYKLVISTVPKLFQQFYLFTFSPSIPLFNKLSKFSSKIANCRTISFTKCVLSVCYWKCGECWKLVNVKLSFLGYSFLSYLSCISSILSFVLVNRDECFQNPSKNTVNGGNQHIYIFIVHINFLPFTF